MLSVSVLRGLERHGASASLVAAIAKRSLSSVTTNKQPTGNGKGSVLMAGNAPSHMLQSRSSSMPLPPAHANAFLMERYWAAGMAPLFPLAFFVHTPLVDYALAISVGMHIHWGLHGVVSDYARPFVIGESLAKMAHITLYVFSAVMFAGLLSFNYNDVGLTKAFELMWSL